MTTRTTHTTRRVAAALLTTAVLAATAGCGDDTEGDAADTNPTAVAAASTMAASLTMEDPWVKAADDGMTAVFGVLVNSGDEDLVVTGATSDLGPMELHETVQNDDGSMAMQPKEGGFAVPAGAEHELAPGQDHLMVMDLQRPLRPGEQVIVLLELADGSTTEVDVTVKEFDGADEKYQGGTDRGDTGHGMEDMQDMEDESR